jgi:hypothetical protein
METLVRRLDERPNEMEPARAVPPPAAMDAPAEVHTRHRRWARGRDEPPPGLSGA